MAVRLLFVLGIAAAFLVLAPESASAHCHEPTVYGLQEAAADPKAAATSGTCGRVARKGGYAAGLGVALSAAGYAAAGWMITKLVRAERIASAVVSAAVKPPSIVPDVTPVARRQEAPPPDRAQRRMRDQSVAREWRRSKRARRARTREIRDAAQQLSRRHRGSTDVQERVREAGELISRSEQAARHGHALREKAIRLGRAPRHSESASVRQIAEQADKALREADELARRAEEVLLLNAVRRPPRPPGGHPRRPPGGFSEGEHLRLHWRELVSEAPRGWEEGTQAVEHVAEVLGELPRDELVGAVVSKGVEYGVGMWATLRRVGRVWPY